MSQAFEHTRRAGSVARWTADAIEAQALNQLTRIELHAVADQYQLDHGAALWRTLGEVMPDYERRRENLRRWEGRGFVVTKARSLWVPPEATPTERIQERERASHRRKSGATRVPRGERFNGMRRDQT